MSDFKWQDKPPSKTPCLVYDGHEQFVAWPVHRSALGRWTWVTTGNQQVNPIMYKELDWPEVGE